MKYLKLYSNDESYMADRQRDLGDLDVWVASTQSENHVYYSSEIDNSLCFTAMEDGAIVQMLLNGNDATPHGLKAKSFSYKKNDDVESTASVQMKLSDEGGTSAGWQAKSFYYKKNNDVAWTEWVFNTNASSEITLNKGEKLYVRSDSYNSCGDFDGNKFYSFNIKAGKISASGNIMSLLNFTPVLPNFAFLGLFMGCTSLVSAPALPATTLTDACYYGMFYGCSSLTQSPALPATTLANSCYHNMFSGCFKLVQAPELPATTLAEGCYSYMFSDCSKLTQAPELPATTLASNCYGYMFSGCSKLNYIKALFTTTPSDTYTSDWVSGVSSTGTFVKSKDATWNVTGVSGIPNGWTVQVEGGVTPEPEPEKDYLCFTSTGDSTVAIKQGGDETPSASANKVIQYKLNDGQWQTWDLSAVSLGDGDKMYLKSDDEIPMSESRYAFKSFVMTGHIAASGNIMSLLNFSTTLANYAFFKLFDQCSSLTTTPALPATTLAENCYNYMFSGCYSLTTAPELPATTLATSCYDSMFNGCTSLTTAPELPATTLAESCYNSMFGGCKKLTTAPELPATTLAKSCYANMFNQCKSLTTAPELPATTLAEYCYSNMFSGHAINGWVPLTQAPELPATTLAPNCYFNMFNCCKNLNYVKAMFTDVPRGALTNWLKDVATTGTFVKNGAATWTNDQAKIPTGWTVTTV